jgi:hypothetical protein
MKYLIKFILFLSIIIFSVNTYAGSYQYSFQNQDYSTSGGGAVKLKMTLWINANDTIGALIEKDENDKIFHGGEMSLLKINHTIISSNRLAYLELKPSQENVTITSENSLDDINDGWIPLSSNSIYETIDIYGVYELGDDISTVGPVTIIREELPDDAYVKVLISPQEVEGIAQWRRVGSTVWKFSNEIIAVDPVSVIEDPEYPFNKPTIEIEFKDIDGWNTPDNSKVTISQGTTITSDAHTYIPGTAAVSVHICPEEIQSQASWEIYLYSISDWSVPYETDFVAKNLYIHPSTPIQFNHVDGWDTPNDTYVDVESGKTKYIKTCYCKQIPGAPPDIIATSGKYTDHIDLSWEKSTSDTEYCDIVYSLYRNTEDSPYTATLLVASIDGVTYKDYSASHSHEYYYWVKAKGPKGSSGFSKICKGYKKLQSPSEVSATSFPVSCEEDFPDRMRVEYPAVDGASHYEIWRMAEGTSIANAVKISSCVLGTTYDDFTAIANRPYAYWVIAKNSFSFSDESPYGWGSKCLAPPRIVNASDGLFSDYVLIDWSLVSDATCYRIIKTEQPINRSLRDGVSIDLCEPPYYDTIAVPGVNYIYRVIALNNYGVKESRPSKGDIGWKTMAAPENVTASQETRVHQVDVCWDRVSDATKGYILYRGIEETFSPDNTEKLADNILGTCYPDTPVTRQYFYWVKAVGEYAVSELSEKAKGIPILCSQHISIEPEVAEFPYEETEGSFKVKFVNIEDDQESKKCVWDISENPTWVTMKTAQGEGKGIVQYTAGNNSTTADRTGEIAVTCFDKTLKHTVRQINIFSLSMDVHGQGLVKVNDSTYTEPMQFDAGTTVDLTYFPENGWHSDVNNLETVTLDNNTSVTVIFNPELIIETEGQGVVDVSDSDIQLGDSITLTAVAEDGWLFKSWRNDITGFDNPTTLIMNSPTTVGAVFEPEGWKADVTIERSNTLQSVSFGVRSVAETNIANISGEYACSIVIPKMPDWNPYLDVDIRLQNENEYSWVLKIDPAGNTSDQNDDPAVIRWNPQQFTDYGYYILTEGYLDDGKVLISNMKETTELTVEGTTVKYYTIRWRSEPWHPIIRLFGAEQIGTYKCSVEIDVADTAYQKDLAPESPDFSCDLSIIPAPDWNSRLSTLIYEDGQNEYNWVIAVNPSGNVGDETATSVLTWDLSTFSGQGGYWKLIKGYEGHYGEVVVQDMTRINQMNVTGTNKRYYYTVRWTRWGYVDLNLQQGWNLITIPLIPNNGNDISVLLPDITTVYDYFDGQYNTPATLEPGKGYWVKLPADAYYRIWGEPVYELEFDLSEGWYLLGGVYGNTVPEAATADSIKVIYKYADGIYKVPDSIAPGLGFWIRITENCHVSMDSF